MARKSRSEYRRRFLAAACLFPEMLAASRSLAFELTEVIDSSAATSIRYCFSSKRGNEAVVGYWYVGDRPKRRRKPPHERELAGALKASKAKIIKVGDFERSGDCVRYEVTYKCK